ncbi:hypothetical protein ACF0H5_014910 [Mactra antiquata]
MLFLAGFLSIICLVSGSFDCSKLFPGSGLSKSYNETIAHAIHSMTVDGLKLFHPHATTKNFVPTVNQDLSQANVVLNHAPEEELDSDFTTMTMNTISKILSTLGNSKDGLGPNWSPIERVAHVFHMWDLWNKIKQEAWNDVLNNKPDMQLCACLASVDGNGIKDAVAWVANHYKTGTPITLLNRPIPKLTDAATWAVWKERLLHYYTPEALNDAAMYLHCIEKFW